MRDKHKYEPEDDYYDDPSDQLSLQEEYEAREAEKADEAYNEMKENEILEKHREFGDLLQEYVSRCEALSNSISRFEDVVFNMQDILSKFNDMIDKSVDSAQEARGKIIYPDKKTATPFKPGEEDCPF